MTGDMHRYRVHGLALRSEIPFPELIPDDDITKTDVVVVVGRVPTSLPDPLFHGARAQAGRGTFLLRVPGVAGYHFAAPSRIVVEPYPGAEAEDVRTFFLSSVMGALLHAQELLPLHASAVRVGDGCILLTGASGSGKSTLAGEFVRQGYELVSDDLTAISVGEDGSARAYPGYRALRLWSDALRRLTGIAAEVRRGRAGHDRRTALVAGVSPSISLPVRSVFILRLRTGPVAVRTLQGAAKSRALIEQSYRLHLLSALGSPSVHYRACQALAQRPVCELDRPAKENTIAELVRLIAGREEIREAREGPS